MTTSCGRSPPPPPAASGHPRWRPGRRPGCLPRPAAKLSPPSEALATDRSHQRPGRGKKSKKSKKGKSSVRSVRTVPPVPHDPGGLGRPAGNLRNPALDNGSSRPGVLTSARRPGSGDWGPDPRSWGWGRRGVHMANEEQQEQGGRGTMQVKLPVPTTRVLKLAALACFALDFF